MSSPDASPSSRLLLVDGHAYAYRAFHAIRSLNSPDGRPTNAIYGFVKMLQKLEATVRPTHRLVVWDAGLAAERMAALPEYKANRPSTPEALDEQLPQLQTWLAAAGWASLQEEGTEADDWLATYARRAEAAGWQTVLASSDKDFMQLVNDRIGLYNPNDKSDKIWVAADVEAKTGVQPAQIVDWLSLVGDSVDNIPGVKGVGPKTATELLKRFGNVEQLVARASELKSEAQRASVQASGELLKRNQLMIRLRDDLVGGHALEALAPRPPENPVLREMYRRWNFRSLLAELGEEAVPAPAAATSPSAPAAPTQGDLF